MPLRQTTLVLGKRPASTDEKPVKKRALASGNGTAAITPICIDAETEPEDPVQQAKHKNKQVALGLELDGPCVPRHEGPTQANPLRINPPSFSLSSTLTGIAPREIKKDPDLDLLFLKTFVRGRQLYEYLLRELPWYRVVYEVRGTSIRTPRWTCVWGCDDTGSLGVAYDIKPRPIPDVLMELKTQVEKETGTRFNFCLVNFYENGQDSISWHLDDESFLGPNPTIASLSLGSPRDFQMRHKTDKSAKQEKWSLQSGDMIVMRGATQANWLHSVPKRAHAEGRINITFRRAMNTAGTNNYYRYNVFTGPVHRWTAGQMMVAPGCSAYANALCPLHMRFEAASAKQARQSGSSL